MDSLLLREKPLADCLFLAAQPLRPALKMCHRHIFLTLRGFERTAASAKSKNRNLAVAVCLCLHYKKDRVLIRS